MQTCENCGSNVWAESLRCVECGATLPPLMPMTDPFRTNRGIPNPPPSQGMLEPMEDPFATNRGIPLNNQGLYGQHSNYNQGGGGGGPTGTPVRPVGSWDPSLYDGYEVVSSTQQYEQPYQGHSSPLWGAVNQQHHQQQQQHDVPPPPARLRGNTVEALPPVPQRARGNSIDAPTQGSNLFVAPSKGGGLPPSPRADSGALPPVPQRARGDTMDATAQRRVMPPSPRADSGALPPVPQRARGDTMDVAAQQKPHHPCVSPSKGGLPPSPRADSGALPPVPQRARGDTMDASFKFGAPTKALLASVDLEEVPPVPNRSPRPASAIGGGNEPLQFGGSTAAILAGLDAEEEDDGDIAATAAKVTPPPPPPAAAKTSSSPRWGDSASTLPPVHGRVNTSPRPAAPEARPVVLPPVPGRAHNTTQFGDAARALLASVDDDDDCEDGADIPPPPETAPRAPALKVVVTESVPSPKPQRVAHAPAIPAPVPAVKKTGPKSPAPSPMADRKKKQQQEEEEVVSLQGMAEKPPLAKAPAPSPLGTRRKQEAAAAPAVPEPEPEVHHSPPPRAQRSMGNMPLAKVGTPTHLRRKSDVGAQPTIVVSEVSMTVPPEECARALADPFWRTQLLGYASGRDGDTVSLWVLLDEWKMQRNPQAKVALAQRVYATYLKDSAIKRDAFPKGERESLARLFDAMGAEKLPPTFFDSAMGSLFGEIDFRIFPAWKASLSGGGGGSPRAGRTGGDGSSSPPPPPPKVTRDKPSKSFSGSPSSPQRSPRNGTDSFVAAPQGANVSAPVLVAGPKKAGTMIPIHEAQAQAGVSNQASEPLAVPPPVPSLASRTSSSPLGSGPPPPIPSMASRGSKREESSSKAPPPPPIASRAATPGSPRSQHLGSALGGASSSHHSLPHVSPPSPKPHHHHRNENIVRDEKWTIESILSDDCTFDWDRLNSGNTKDNIDVVKCLVVGDQAVGKTELCKTMLGDEYHPEYVPTVFETYKIKVPIFKEVPVEMWDMSGKEKYDKKRPVVYPNVNCILICFDLTDPSTWLSVTKKWIPEAMSYPDNPLFVVGCKFDLIDAKTAHHTVSIADVKRYLDTHCMGFKCYRYFTASAVSGAGLEDIFQAILYATLYNVKASKADTLNPKLSAVKDFIK